MNYLVVLVANNIEGCTDILDEWEAAGVQDVTILASAGLSHIRRMGMRDDLPLMPTLQDLLASEEIPHRTLLSVVDSQELVDKMVEIAQETICEPEDGNRGFLFVVPVQQVYHLGA